jgi:hypothetical protein
MFPQISQAPLNVISTDQRAPLGAVHVSAGDQSRRAYRYVSFPASTAFTSGVLLVAAAAPANSTGLALPTSNTTAQLSSGSRQLIVTNGATAVVQDQFADGVLEVLGTNGIGQSYRIVGNSAAAASGAITLNLLDALRNTTALANGTNTVNLRVSPYRLPVSQTTKALPVGVTIMPVASNASVQYGWVQVGGPAYCNATSGTKGGVATQDIATNAGNVADSAASTTAPIGTFMESAASSLAPVMLSINSVI